MAGAPQNLSKQRLSKPRDKKPRSPDKLMKQFSKACERNREPIGDVLQKVLPDGEEVTVLEVGSGTGQHGVAFARRFPRILWQPTNRPGRLESIKAWRREADLDNLLPPLCFDLFDESAPVEGADMVVAINVIHIAPFEATKQLFHHAQKLLEPGSPIFLYGPYRFRDRPLELSNERFDGFLQRRDPKSGLRLFEEVDQIADEHGFTHVETRRLPANNDAIWWVR